MLAHNFSDTASPAGSSDARLIRNPEARRALDWAIALSARRNERIAPREVPLEPIRMDIVWPFLEPAQSVPSQRPRKMAVCEYRDDD